MGIRERWHDFCQKNICATDESPELTKFLDEVDAGKNELLPNFKKRFAPMYFGYIDGKEQVRLMFKWGDVERSVRVIRDPVDNTFVVKEEGFFSPTDSADL